MESDDDDRLISFQYILNVLYVHNRRVQCAYTARAKFKEAVNPFLFDILAAILLNQYTFAEGRRYAVKFESMIKFQFLYHWHAIFTR